MVAVCLSSELKPKLQNSIRPPKALVSFLKVPKRKWIVDESWRSSIKQLISLRREETEIKERVTLNFKLIPHHLVSVPVPVLTLQLFASVLAAGFRQLPVSAPACNGTKV